MQIGLIEKIEQKEAEITVVGLGRVGLVTAVMFAHSGFQVQGVDIKPEILRIVSSGNSPFREAGIGQLVKKAVDSERLTVTDNTSLAAKNADVGVICVQTPLINNKAPNLLYIRKACEDFGQGLSKGKLVVVESTVPPGTTKELVAGMLEKKSGLKCGRDFWLAHCPERIWIGKAIAEFSQSPRIVGGYNPKSTEVAAKLYEKVTQGQILTADCTTAEVAKVAENTFRDVNIAFANELALICEKLDVDVMEVIQLANTHPRVTIHKPGCGVGGPCLAKDPYLLLHSVGKRDFESKLIEISRKLNDLMPDHTVELVADGLKRADKDIKTSKIVVLGTAYRGETSDCTNTPSEKIVRALMHTGAEVVVYDPYCDESFGARTAEELTSAVVEADCLVTVTDHLAFKALKLEEIKRLMNKRPVIVDGRRIVDHIEARNLGFIYLGIGSSHSQK